jgi:hypothetical protein
MHCKRRAVDSMVCQAQMRVPYSCDNSCETQTDFNPLSRLVPTMLMLETRYTNCIKRMK